MGRVQDACPYHFQLIWPSLVVWSSGERQTLSGNSLYMFRIRLCVSLDHKLGRLDVAIADDASLPIFRLQLESRSRG